MSGSRATATNCRTRKRRFRLSIENRSLRFLAQTITLCALAISIPVAGAQGMPNPAALTWDQVKARFESANPTMKADATNVDEMRAQEITAFLRPNPQFTLSSDGTQIAPHNGIWQPTKGTQWQMNFSYLHERQRKRELRLESAKEGTQIAASLHSDLYRNLLFNVRVAFIGILQAKAILDVTQQELEYYDHIIDISQEKFKPG